MAQVRAGAIKTMPNQEMSAQPISRRGAILLGDAWNMRHPLTGGGMTVCFADVRALRDSLRKVPSGRLDDASKEKTLHSQLDAFRHRPRHTASTINILAAALHEVFASSDPVMLPMRDACYAYLKKG